MVRKSVNFSIASDLDNTNLLSDSIIDNYQDSKISHNDARLENQETYHPLTSPQIELPPTPMAMNADPIDVTEKKVIETKSSEKKVKKLQPVMASYGTGNVHPIVPSHHLKTFNVRAPASQVYHF